MGKYQSAQGTGRQLRVEDLHDGEAFLCITHPAQLMQGITISSEDVKKVIKDLEKILKGKEL